MIKDIYYATGRRKEAVAKLRLWPGKGRFLINGRELQEYFPRPALVMVINQPLELTESSGHFDIEASVNGGGMSGQAGAVRLALSRALTVFNPELRKSLKTAGFLTRDARVVERKKYGLVKARKRFQFSKR